MKRFVCALLIALLMITVIPLESSAVTPLTIALSYYSEVIPDSTSLLSNGVVSGGKPTYRVKMKAIVSGSSNFTGTPITFNNPASSTVVRVSADSVLNASGSVSNYTATVYATYDVRGTVTSFSCTATIGGTSYSGTKTATINVPVASNYSSQFFITYYVIADESDYTGSYDTAAAGISGKLYRSAFLNAVKMQGSGYSHYGEYMQYQSGSYTIVSQPSTATGTVPTINKTIAVDPYYIPRLSSARAKVQIGSVGDRQAEDGGGAITGRHIDVFYGTGLPSSDPSWSATNKTVYYYGNNLW